MPLPNVQVLKDMNGLYLELDKGMVKEVKKVSQSSTLYSKTKMAVSSGFNTVVNWVDPAAANLIDICKPVEKMENGVHTAEGWLDLMELLFKQAKKAQGEKTKKEEQSRCCKMLLGKFSYIMDVMTSGNDECKAAYDARIKRIEGQIAVLQKKIDEDVESFSGVNNKKLTDEQNDTYGLLSFMLYKEKDLRYKLNTQRMAKLDWLRTLNEHDKASGKKSVCRGYANDAFVYCNQNFRMNTSKKKDVFFWEILINDSYRKQLQDRPQSWVKESIKKGQFEKRREEEEAKSEIDEMRRMHTQSQLTEKDLKQIEDEVEQHNDDDDNNNIKFMDDYKPEEEGSEPELEKNDSEPDVTQAAADEDEVLEEAEEKVNPSPAKPAPNRQLGKISSSLFSSNELYLTGERKGKKEAALETPPSSPPPTPPTSRPGTP